MPQFDFANFIPQIFWLAIFFAVLYFGVVRLTLPKVGRVMTAREDQVSGDLDTAERAKRESDRLQADYDADVADAQSRARARIVDAQASAAAALDARLKESNAVLDGRAKEAGAALDKARGRAMSEIESVAAEAAGDIVERFTGTRPGSAEAGQAAREALA